MAYLSKQLDSTIRGWALCFRALAAASLLIQESKNLLSDPPSLSSPPIASLLHAPSRVLSLQVSLVEDPTLTFVPFPPTPNPATLLPFPAPSMPLAHSCSEALQEFLPCPDHPRRDTSPHGS
jgi:hypothetical protein